jgi:hypothetical protein
MRSGLSGVQMRGSNVCQIDHIFNIVDRSHEVQNSGEEDTPDMNANMQKP